MQSVLLISRYRGLLAAGCLGLLLVVNGIAAAAPLDNAATAADPQRYVMTLAQTPVSQVAEEVLGQTLGLPVSVDPRISGVMTFRVDGIYSPQALAQELGLQLWEVDVALVEDRAEGLVLIPVEALPEAMAKGGVLVAPRPPTVADQKPAASDPPVTTVPEARAPDRLEGQGVPWLALLALALVLGWIGGMGTPALMRRLRTGIRGTGHQNGRLSLELSDPNASEAGQRLEVADRLSSDVAAPELAMPERPAQDVTGTSRTTSADLGIQPIPKVQSADDSSAVIAIDFRSRTR